MNATITPMPPPGGRTASAGHCTASDMLRWAGLPALADAATDALPLALKRVLADRRLVHEGQPFEQLHVVAAGSFKCVQTDVEGYEQVLGFAVHGDVLGLDALGHPTHRSGAIALEDASVVVLPIHELKALSRELPALAAFLEHAAGVEIQRRAETQYLMSATSSVVRVARFLLHLAQRQSALGYSRRRLRIVMTRRDIASHLGIAHETVSRALGALSQQGCVQVSMHELEIVDEDALRALQRITRRRSIGELQTDGPHTLAA
jgi:CRP/FNR family transcriptional regulator, anaerobic regulatory protein